MSSRTALPIVAIALLAGCYHATVETGLSPSAQTMEKSFASSWIGGLVPPSAVSTMARCPSGVARVETQLSFVNMLVGFITAGIYTPMDIKVTCASGGRSSLAPGSATLGVRDDAPASVMQAVLTTAAATSASSGAPVFVTLVAPQQ